MSVRTELVASMLTFAVKVGGTRIGALVSSTVGGHSFTNASLEQGPHPRHVGCYDSIGEAQAALLEAYEEGR